MRAELSHWCLVTCSLWGLVGCVLGLLGLDVPSVAGVSEEAVQLWLLVCMGAAAESSSFSLGWSVWRSVWLLTTGCCFLSSMIQASPCFPRRGRAEPLPAHTKCSLCPPGCVSVAYFTTFLSPQEQNLYPRAPTPFSVCPALALSLSLDPPTLDISCRWQWAVWSLASGLRHLVCLLGSLLWTCQCAVPVRA